MMQLESVTPSEEEVDDSILSYKILEKEGEVYPVQSLPYLETNFHREEYLLLY